MFCLFKTAGGQCIFSVSREEQKESCEESGSGVMEDELKIIFFATFHKIFGGGASHNMYYDVEIILPHFAKKKVLIRSEAGRLCFSPTYR